VIGGEGGKNTQLAPTESGADPVLLSVTVHSRNAVCILWAAAVADGESVPIFSDSPGHS
jgi:hypothetical protein